MQTNDVVVVRILKYLVRHLISAVAGDRWIHGRKLRWHAGVESLQDLEWGGAYTEKVAAGVA